jgi:molybdate transport system ATP-binding protein
MSAKLTINAKIYKPLHGVNGSFALDASLQVDKGEFVALYGPSGVGKTTLLRCLAGLDHPASGEIVVQTQGQTQVWFNGAQHIQLAPQHRRVGYMFQDYALFPNMTVRDNLAFALRKGANKQRVDELLAMIELGALQHHKPVTLSGGQRQRVALARALASEPEMLLLDEPLSALDASIRARLQDEILKLQRSMGITTIMVSHDVGEVYKLASRVLVMESGKIIQQGTPVEVFSAGQTSGKFRFTGEILVIEPMDVMFALTVLVGNQIVRVVAMPNEAASLQVGDAVMLVSKAFNPMVIKL